jgi:hypothetical protein
MHREICPRGKVTHFLTSKFSPQTYQELFGHQHSGQREELSLHFSTILLIKALKSSSRKNFSSNTKAFVAICSI